MRMWDFKKRISVSHLLFKDLFRCWRGRFATNRHGVVPQSTVFSAPELALEGSQTLGNDLRKQARLLMPTWPKEAQRALWYSGYLQIQDIFQGAGMHSRILTDWWIHQRIKLCEGRSSTNSSPSCLFPLRKRNPRLKRGAKSSLSPIFISASSIGKRQSAWPHQRNI